MALIGGLLGLMGLAGGALGQEWWNQEQNKKGQALVRGLLGREPDPVPDGGYSNPDPGSGLMRDPGNLQEQLKFAAGIMGLPSNQRDAARSLVEPILGRGSQAALTREGWDRQDAGAAVAEVNTQRRFDVTDQRITEQHAETERRLRDQMALDSERFGVEQAWKRYTFGQQQALAWSGEARQRNAAALEAEKTRLEIERLKNPFKTPNLPTGYEHAVVGTGAPSDKPLAPGVMGPVRTDPGQIIARPITGTPDWVKGQEKVSLVTTLVENIDELTASLKRYGSEQTGPEASRQSSLYSRIVASVGGNIDKLGTLQEGDLKRLAAEMPNPSEYGYFPVSNDRMLAAFAELRRQAEAERQKQEQTYRGWNLNYGGGRVKVEAGRDKPPEGSKPMNAPGEYYRRPGGR